MGEETRNCAGDIWVVAEVGRNGIYSRQTEPTGVGLVLVPRMAALLSNPKQSPPRHPKAPECENRAEPHTSVRLGRLEGRRRRRKEVEAVVPAAESGGERRVDHRSAAHWYHASWP